MIDPAVSLKSQEIKLPQLIIMHMLMVKLPLTLQLLLMNKICSTASKKKFLKENLLRRI
jgi:hypothetical protein